LPNALRRDLDAEDLDLILTSYAELRGQRRQAVEPADDLDLELIAEARAKAAQPQ